MYPSYLDTGALQPLTVRVPARYPGHDLLGSGRHTRRGPRATTRRLRRL